MEEKIKTVCDGQGIKPVSVNVLLGGELPPPQDEKKQKDDIEKTKKTFTGIIRIYRMIRKNPDIFFLVLFGISVFASGFCMAFVVMSFSVAQIKVGIIKFAWLIISLLGSGIGCIGNLYSLRGMMSQAFRLSCNRMVAKANKDNVDNFGYTIDK